VSNGRVKPLAVRRAHSRLVEWGTKGVKGDVDSIGVSANLEQISHYLSSISTKFSNVVAEVFDPVLDERGLDNLNLHLFNDIAYFSAQGVGRILKEHGKVWSYGGINEYSLVEVCESLGIGFESGDTAHGGILEHTERVALCEEFVDVTSGEGTLEKEHNIFNHVLVGDEIEESCERLNSLGANILEFCDKLFGFFNVKRSMVRK
jgi:hypothetical protein